MKSRHIILVILYCIVVILVRLRGIGNPIGDWHSWRQVDTAAVARHFLKDGIDITHPRYDDLSNIQSGKDNPMGYRMVEVPLYQATAVLVSRMFSVQSIEVSLRAVTIAASVGIGIILWSLGGWVAAFVFALLPYSIYYGRAILPEMFAVFWALLSVRLVSKNLAVSAVAAAIAIAVKPTAGFLLLPVVYGIVSRNGITIRSCIRLLVFAMVCIVPFLAWRLWILRFPEGIPAFDWLLNKGNIRFKGAWFYWLFAKRIAELILGYWGILPFGVGFALSKNSRHRWQLGLLAGGSILYLVIFAAGNVQHDYYQIILLPVLSLIVANGLSILWRQQKILTMVTVAFMFAFSWYTIRTYWWINRPEIIEAGKEADRILPKEAKVIAPYNGDTTFLYQTGRQGWPLGFEIDKKISMGATAYVTVSPTDTDLETKELAEKYTVLVRNDHFAIIDLTKPTRP